MALSADQLKAHLNGVPEEDEPMLVRLLGAATAHVERVIGYRLTDTEELPEGPPEDLEQAVLMLAADWYENREASVVNASVMPVPFGLSEILAEYRRYTYG